jgi:hypothetical protein
MMTREQAIGIVNIERAYQDRTYNPNEELSSGRTRADRDKDVTSHLVLLQIYVDKAMVDWNVAGDNRPSLKQIVKIAAIAVRALERAGGSEALLAEGLR